MAQIQKGSALIISLVFLLLLSVIGIAAVQNSSLEERMAGNSADKNRAFQTAEAGLRAAEKLLLTHQADYALESVSLVPTTDDKPTAPGWNQLTVTGVDAANSPWYRIQRLSCVTNASGCGYIYLITAIGYGNEPGARVVLQSAFKP